MSIVFAAGKRSAAIVKGREEEPRRGRRKTSVGSDTSQKDALPTLFPVVHFTTQLMRSICVYKPTEDIVVWNLQIGGKQQSIALQKSSMDIWFEDERLDYMTTTEANISKMTFLLLGKKAVILHHHQHPNKSGSFELQIEDDLIPPCSIPSDTESDEGGRWRIIGLNCARNVFLLQGSRSSPFVADSLRNLPSRSLPPAGRYSTGELQGCQGSQKAHFNASANEDV
ncbi:hypothetical protein TcWFU_004435 [Taenia crassiceps]|uniref:Uncharacterized protein n=1 Tax=Taenia crassiceps TaxID=6207 RepID=A0ABR4QD99_9CEST